MRLAVFADELKAVGALWRGGQAPGRDATVAARLDMARDWLIYMEGTVVEDVFLDAASHGGARIPPFARLAEGLEPAIRQFAS